ncbi:hypothetical protein Pan216_40720 [Planctomycetes bacterium Pan216]|uniref:Uncharacterized protein n=1 Tax=Kolteria novifilia TaxID=2527975 RepID=A0A518B896_9BACT|nr:hypothetical protein Pan216_40720 [Planctomycetes bacterium Pan216]
MRFLRMLVGGAGACLRWWLGLRGNPDESDNAS